MIRYDLVVNDNVFADSFRICKGDNVCDLA